MITLKLTLIIEKIIVGHWMWFHFDDFHYPENDDCELSLQTETFSRIKFTFCISLITSIELVISCVCKWNKWNRTWNNKKRFVFHRRRPQELAEFLNRLMRKQSATEEKLPYHFSMWAACFYFTPPPLHFPQGICTSMATQKPLFI